MLTMEPLVSQPPILFSGCTPGLLPLGGNRATSFSGSDELTALIDGALAPIKGMAVLGACVTICLSEQPSRLPEERSGVRLDRPWGDGICYFFPRMEAFQATSPSVPYREHAALLTTCLGLGKSDISRILGVSRPTLYSWISGDSEPQERDHPELLRRLGEMVADCCRTTRRPLYHRFVEEPLPKQDQSIHGLLLQKPWDEERLRRLLSIARQMTTERDQRLGHLARSSTSRQQREANLLDSLVAVDQG
jgi:hypothetical protein